LQSSYVPRYQPIIVTALGRSGTTWMMRNLSLHPEIIVYRVHPYEFYLGRYWISLVQTLAAPGDNPPCANPNQLAHNPYPSCPNPHELIGHMLPNQRWLGKCHAEEVAKFCQSSIDSFYKRIAEYQEQEDARFFAEKHAPDGIPRLTWEIYDGAKEIFLIRDLRDVGYSVLSFNAKNRSLDFSRMYANSDEEYFTLLNQQGLTLLQSWHERRNRAFLVKYEDLILKPEPTLQELFQYLGLDHSPAIIQEIIQKASQDTAELKGHRTSGSVEQSIGRWRRELPGPLQDHCRTCFSEVLAGFGYQE
jgi:hypothetical protein